MQTKQSLEDQLTEIERILKTESESLTKEGRAWYLGIRRALLFALGQIDSLGIGRGVIE